MDESCFTTESSFALRKKKDKKKTDPVAPGGYGLQQNETTRLLIFKKMCAFDRVRHSQSDLYKQVQALLIFGLFREREKEKESVKFPVFM